MEKNQKRTPSDATPARSSRTLQTTAGSSFSNQEKRILGAHTNLSTLQAASDKEPAEFSRKFGVVIGRIAASNGMAAPSTPEEKTLLATKIVDQFPDMNLYDLEAASDLNSMEADPKLRISHFGRLSFDWLAQVLNRYRNVKRDLLRRYRKQLPPPREEQVRPEDLWIGLKNIYLKTGKMPIFYAWDKVYNHLNALGLITATDQEKRILYQKIAEETPDGIDTLVGRVIAPGERQDRIRSRCRQELIHKLLKTFK